MPKYIDCDYVASKLEKHYRDRRAIAFGLDDVLFMLEKCSAADVVEVVRCKDCCFAVPLDKHCEINSSTYRHCLLLRGDETRNVWHKCTKYYKDYSIVELDEFCSEGKPHEQALGMKEGAEE